MRLRPAGRVVLAVLFAVSLVGPVLCGPAAEASEEGSEEGSELSRKIESAEAKVQEIALREVEEESARAAEESSHEASEESSRAASSPHEESSHEESGAAAPAEEETGSGLDQRLDTVQKELQELHNAPPAAAVSSSPAAADGNSLLAGALAQVLQRALVNSATLMPTAAPSDEAPSATRDAREARARAMEEAEHAEQQRAEAAAQTAAILREGRRQLEAIKAVISVADAARGVPKAAGGEEESGGKRDAEESSASPASEESSRAEESSAAGRSAEESSAAPAAGVDVNAESGRVEAIRVPSTAAEERREANLDPQNHGLWPELVNTPNAPTPSQTAASFVKTPGPDFVVPDVVPDRFEGRSSPNPPTPNPGPAKVPVLLEVAGVNASLVVSPVVDATPVIDGEAPRAPAPQPHKSEWVEPSPQQLKQQMDEAAAESAAPSGPDSVGALSRDIEAAAARVEELETLLARGTGEGTASAELREKLAGALQLLHALQARLHALGGAAPGEQDRERRLESSMSASAEESSRLAADDVKKAMGSALLQQDQSTTGTSPLLSARASYKDVRQLHRLLHSGVLDSV